MSLVPPFVSTTHSIPRCPRSWPSSPRRCTDFTSLTENRGGHSVAGLDRRGLATSILRAWRQEARTRDTALRHQQNSSHGGPAMELRPIRRSARGVRRRSAAHRGAGNRAAGELLAECLRSGDGSDTAWHSRSSKSEVGAETRQPSGSAGRPRYLRVHVHLRTGIMKLPHVGHGPLGSRPPSE